MKSYALAAVALASAVAHGAVFRRQGSHGSLPCGATASTTYTVVSGDNLTAIADSTNGAAGICDIAAASGVTNVNYLIPGQVLTIPQCTAPVDNNSCLSAQDVPATELCVAGLPSAYTIVSGDTLTAVAKSFNITLDALIGANNQIANPDVISVGQVVDIPVCPNSQCASVGTYNIVSGDVFVDLAAKYNATLGALLALNPTVNVTALAVGQQIILPQNCRNITSTTA